MRDPVAITHELKQNIRAYDFFAALRLLECAHPEQPRIGESLRPSDDPLRFGQEAALAFAPSAFREWISAEPGGVDRVMVSFFGLFGPHGPLPDVITEHVRDRERNSADSTTARFLDIFHHRMISLLYRSWATAQPVVSLDRPQSNRFADYLASLVGMGMPGLRDHDTVPDFAKLFFAGQIGRPPGRADSLEKVIGDFFDVPVRIEQFIGGWLSLATEQRCRLRSGHRAPLLGESTVLGARVYSAQSKFRIMLGPLKRADYERFLPGSVGLGQLRDWVRNIVGDALDFDVQLILQQDHVPRLALDGRAQLGYTSWLLTSGARTDGKELIVEPARATH